MGRLCLKSLLSSPCGCWSGAAKLCCPGHCPLPAAPVLALGTAWSCPCTNALSPEPCYSKWFCSELSGAARAQGRCPGHKQLFRLSLPASQCQGEQSWLLPFSSTSSDSTAQESWAKSPSGRGFVPSQLLTQLHEEGTGTSPGDLCPPVSL